MVNTNCCDSERTESPLLADVMVRCCIQRQTGGGKVQTGLVAAGQRIDGDSGRGVRLLKNLQDTIEGVAKLAVIRHIHGEVLVAIRMGGGAAVGEQDGGGALLVMGAGFDPECHQIVRAQEQGIHEQCSDGQAVAIEAQAFEPQIGRLDGDARGVEELGVAGVPIVVAALGLISADFGEFREGVKGLIAAGAEQDFRLRGQVMLQQQTESGGRTALQ